MQAKVVRHSAEGATADSTRPERATVGKPSFAVAEKVSTPLDAAFCNTCYYRTRRIRNVTRNRSLLSWLSPCCLRGMPAKSIVYLLRSVADPTRPYVGLTHDLEARLVAHNAGRCAHTARHRPWEVVVAVRFADEPTAIRFERYLKSGSGRAFARRHFEGPSRCDSANERCGTSG
jgi:putative endonuclease